MRLISKKSVLRILQEEPSYYDTQNAITEIYDKINELPTIEERKTMTHEEAVGFLQESGWLQDHDRQIYEQGKRDGIKWISVTERFPDKEGDYLTTKINDYDEPIVGMTYYSEEWGWSTSFLITAWMPLPEHYEEGAENETD